MRNENKVVKNVIYGISGLTLLLLIISLGAQTPSSAQLPPDVDGNKTTIQLALKTEYIRARIM